MDERRTVRVEPGGAANGKVRLNQSRHLIHERQPLGTRDLQPPQRRNADATGQLVRVQVERRKKVLGRVAVVKILNPARLATVGVRERLVIALDVLGVDDAARRSCGARLAVHRRERRDVAKPSYFLAVIDGPVRLAAILDDAQASILRQRQDGIHIDRFSDRMHDEDRGGFRTEARFDLLDARIEAAGIESMSRGFSPLRMMAESVPGSVIGETATSLPLGRSSAAMATKTATVPVATASAYPPPIQSVNIWQ